MKKINSIHFVGIKGVGMTPLAIIAKEAGISVTGSDIGKVFITDTALQKVGITTIYATFAAEHVANADVVITTIAHEGLKNIEVMAAKRNGIPVWTQAEAVGIFMNGNVLGKSFEGISITGTHGKTTTTSMLATLLQQVALDPSYIIGTSAIPSLITGLPGYLGKGKYFIAEADEYVGEYEENGEIKKRTKFLWQYPKYLLMTSLELDHPDVYANIEAIEENFLQFAKQIPSDGTLIFNGDDERLQLIAKQVECQKISYGFSTENDISVDKNQINVGLDVTTFYIQQNNIVDPTLFSLHVHGEHNIQNAMAVICMGQQLGISLQKMSNGLALFQGSKRRLERVIPTNEQLPKHAIYYDDYAHHPTEIQATLTTLRSLYPGYTIVCIFQPHTYSRTKALFSEFSHAFSAADEVILTDIFSSAREAIDTSVSSQALTEAVKDSGKEAKYIANLDDVVKYMHKQSYPAKTVIVTMGAGDIYTILT